MYLLAIVFAITAIFKAIILKTFEINPFTESHLLLLIPDLLFATAVSFWLIRIKKLPLTVPFIGWLVAYISSYIWDFQPGYEFIKVLIMPGLLALILNMQRFNSLRIWPTIRMMLPVLLQPIESIKSLAVSVFPLGKKSESKSKDEEFSFPVVPAISAGAVLGLGMLLVLVGLDEEFAEFLRIADIWDIIAISFWTFLLNILSFFWFAWHPTFVRVDDSHAHNYQIKRFLQFGIIIATAVCIAYSIYDFYIVMRVLNMIQLAFETIGRNTQLYFIELVALGGTILFLSSYIINGIYAQADAAVRNRARNYVLFIALAVMLLLPPLYNLFRVLLGVYIPEFGFSARRLFGIYTGVAFLVAAGVFYWNTFKTRSAQFAQVLVSFFLTVSLLSFAIPSNYIIFQSQLKNYLQGRTADFEYANRMRMGKTAWMILPSLPSGAEARATDTIWKYLLANRAGNNVMEDEAWKQLQSDIRAHAIEIEQNAIAYNFSAIANTYSASYQVLGYNDGPVENLSIKPETSVFIKRFSDDVKRSITRDKYLQITNFDISYVYQFPSPLKVLDAGNNGGRIIQNRIQNGIQRQSLNGRWITAMKINGSTRSDRIMEITDTYYQPLLCMPDKKETCTENSLKKEQVIKYLLSEPSLSR